MMMMIVVINNQWRERMCVFLCLNICFDLFLVIISELSGGSCDNKNFSEWEKEGRGNFCDVKDSTDDVWLNRQNKSPVASIPISDEV